MHLGVIRADLSTGTLRWRQRTGRQIQSTPVEGEAVGGRTASLYVGDYDGCLYAFAATTGVRRWRACTHGRLESSPAVYTLQDVERNGNTRNVSATRAAELVIVGSGDGHVYAFDDTGAVRWATRLGRAVGLTGSGGVVSSAHLSGHVAYIGGPDALWALDARSGLALWRYRMGGKAVGSSPRLTADGRHLYVGGEDGYMYAFALHAG